MCGWSRFRPYVERIADFGCCPFKKKLTSHIKDIPIHNKKKRTGSGWLGVFDLLQFLSHNRISIHGKHPSQWPWTGNLVLFNLLFSLIHNVSMGRSVTTHIFSIMLLRICQGMKCINNWCSVDVNKHYRVHCSVENEHKKPVPNWCGQ